MEDRQSSRQSVGGSSSVFQPPVNKNKTEELGEKMKKIDVKPPTALGLLAKNTALLPSGIVRVKQLRDAALNQASPSSGASSSGSATGCSSSSLLVAAVGVGSRAMRAWCCCRCQQSVPVPAPPQELQTPGNPRNKTALAPGHSLMDWIRLGSSGVDLTGVGGKLLSVTPAELAKHNTENDAWIAIRGIVFNVSRYMSFHPGGVPELMKGAGKDATKLFDDVHAWVNYQSILQKCVVGKLERSAGAELLFESDKPKPKKSTKSATEPVPDPPAAVKMDWRQTTNTVSMFYAATQTAQPLGECRVKKLTDSEFSLRICPADKSGDIVTHNVKLIEEVEWPPNCQRSSEAPEVEIVFKKKSRGIWKKYGSFSETREKADSTQRTYNEYEVLENTPLCKIVHLLVLRAPNYMQIVPPGRHVEAKMKVLGTEVSRLYTPVPSFIHPEERPATALTDDCLCLMVKRYEDGAMTPSLTALEPGQKLCLSNTLGDFVAEDFDSFAAMHLLAAGTGLTVMLPIVKRALSRRNPPSINLINFNRDEDSIFYAQELDRVSGERTLSVTHVLSAADSSWSGKRGRVSEDLLKDLMGEQSPKACVFTCGPPGFMEVAGESLRKLGWQASQMHEFEG